MSVIRTLKHNWKYMDGLSRTAVLVAIGFYAYGAYKLCAFLFGHR